MIMESKTNYAWLIKDLKTRTVTCNIRKFLGGCDAFINFAPHIHERLGIRILIILENLAKSKRGTGEVSNEILA